MIKKKTIFDVVNDVSQSRSGIDKKDNGCQDSQLGNKANNVVGTDTERFK